MKTFLKVMKVLFNVIYWIGVAVTIFVVALLMGCAESSGKTSRRRSERERRRGVMCGPGGSKRR